MLCKQIRIRQLQDSLSGFERSTFPNLEQPQRKQRINEIMAELRQLEGLPDEPPKLDKVGLQRMKDALSGSSRFIKVKQ